MNSRRQFMQLAAVSGVAVLAGREALAADAPILDEKDPQAVALGYVTDATKANKAKFPSYMAGQQCANCSFFQGKPTDALGPCPLYGGKRVSSKGWCSAYAKKA